MNAAWPLSACMPLLSASFADMHAEGASGFVSRRYRLCPAHGADIPRAAILELKAGGAKKSLCRPLMIPTSFSLIEARRRPRPAAILPLNAIPLLPRGDDWSHFVAARNEIVKLARPLIPLNAQWVECLYMYCGECLPGDAVSGKGNIVRTIGKREVEDMAVGAAVLASVAAATRISASSWPFRPLMNMARSK